MKRFRVACPILFIAGFLVALMASGGCRPRAPKSDPTKSVLQFHVNVPADTDANATIFLSGNLPELGEWSGKGVQLSREKAGEYTGTIALPRGAQTIEFKVTRGSWETVEKNADQTETTNHSVSLDADHTVNLTVAAWRKPIVQRPTTTGDVRYHKAFHSAVLNNDRNLIVWLPPGYEVETNTRFAVLYMHDGQNVFDDVTSFAGEWHADEIATRLIEQKRIEPIIIVAVENAGAARLDEYTPMPGPKSNGRGAGTQPSTQPIVMEGGRGELYSRFLIDEVKPFIDETYRTLPDREHTAVCGSSLGGLISLHLGWKHGDVFGKLGIVSPSLWWNKRAVILALETDNAWMRREKMWVDMGTAEGSGNDQKDNLYEARELHAIMLRARLVEDRDFRFREVAGASHNERSWSDRFDEILIFLFGK